MIALWIRSWRWNDEFHRNVFTMDCPTSSTKVSRRVCVLYSNRMDVQESMFQPFFTRFLVAQEEIHDLPEEMEECMLMYVPKVGYLLVVQPWKENLTENDCSAYPNLQFLFLSAGIPHFKSKVTDWINFCLPANASVVRKRTNKLTSFSRIFSRDSAV